MPEYNLMIFLGEERAMPRHDECKQQEELRLEPRLFASLEEK